MNRYATLAICFLSQILLLGCETPTYSQYDPHYAFPSTAELKTAYLDIAPLQRGNPLSADQARIDEFVAAYHHQGEAPISVTVTAPSIYDVAGRKEAANTAAWLQRRGVPASDIRLFVAESPVAAGPQLTFPIYVVTPRDCGNWSSSIERDHYSQDTDNFGCATQKNIDAMAANPRDLLMARDSTGRDGQRSWQIVDNYLRGKPIPGSDDIKAGIVTTTGAYTAQ